MIWCVKPSAVPSIFVNDVALYSPKIRGYLLYAWHKHNAQALAVTFVRFLELTYPTEILSPEHW